jgi:hypothetical protein
VKRIKKGDLVRFRDHREDYGSSNIALVLSVYQGIPKELGPNKPTKLCDIVWQTGSSSGHIIRGFFAREFEVMDESR